MTVKGEGEGDLPAGGKVLGHGRHQRIDAPFVVGEVTTKQPLVPGEGVRVEVTWVRVSVRVRVRVRVRVGA